MGRGPLRGPPPPPRHSGKVTAFPRNGGRGPSSEQPRPGSLSAAETRSGPGPSGYTAPGPDCWTPPPTICSGVPGFQQAGTGPELWNSAHGQHTLAARGPARRPCRPPAHTKQGAAFSEWRKCHGNSIRMTGSEGLMGAVSAPAPPSPAQPCPALPCPWPLAYHWRPLEGQPFAARVTGALICLHPGGWLAGMTCSLTSGALCFCCCTRIYLSSVLTIYVITEMSLNLASSGLGREPMGVATVGGQSDPAWSHGRNSFMRKGNREAL